MLKIIYASFDIFNSKRREQSDSEVSKRRHVPRTMASADGRSVFAEGKIFSVMKFVFNIPVATLKFGKLFSVKLIELNVGNEIHILAIFLAGLYHFTFAMEERYLLHVGKRDLGMSRSKH